MICGKTRSTTTPLANPPVVRNASARQFHDDRFNGGTRLREYGGIVAGYAETWAGAFEVDRSAILEAVSGPVEPFMFIDGRKGTDNPGGATNRIRSEEHDRDGVDRIFLALLKDQFPELRSAVT